MAEFSVLLPVYIGDRPDFFERALRSVGADQVLQPSQIVVMCDGPVESGVEALLQRALAGDARETVGDAQLRVARFSRNRGLSAALNAGLNVCDFDIVARADADDISAPTRFARQIPLLEEGYDLVGSAIQEFDQVETEGGLIRRMPAAAEEIRAVITYRDPFNHPTVVYRASAVRKAGGYQHIDHMEDYWLFARMVAQGQRCANLEEPLVRYRIGAGAYDRRGGWSMLSSEIDLQRHLRRAGITTLGQTLRNACVRGGYRLVPSRVRRTLYHVIGARIWFS